jgi:4-hydroxy-tetrahydrodipicolinate synthase
MSFAQLEHGVWQILATPFRGADMGVDHASLRRVVEHAQAVGVAGVVALGVLGEAARLDSAERAAVLRTVVEAAGGLPVVAGVSALSTASAVEQAVAAADGGASAVMVLVHSGNPDVLSSHLRAISDACGIGVVVQDHPATTGITIAPNGLVSAITAADVAVAVKAEAPPTPATVAAVGAELDLPVFGGLGGVGLLDELASGAAGAMTGFAYPEALITGVKTFQEDGFAAAKAALEPYLPLMVCEAQVPISLAVRKELLRRRGLIDEAGVRPPGAALPIWAGPIIDAHLGALDAAGLAFTTEVRT